ncbi:Gfo/Idh/MocA family protein [Rubrimonas sp.]|uniref:Gfo/Idh/MocA family protein n=1 Tax=Rubrimonas sp. TaxID=2036015 RepID=UPI002FDC9DBC
MRIVLVGCGRQSRAWIKAAQTVGGFELCGFVDVDVEAAAALAREAGCDGAAVGSDLAAVLAAARPEAVFDIVPPDVRPAVVHAALGHGCHVLSEKPMAPSLADAHAMVAAARAAGRVHAIIQNRRYVPGVRRARAFLDSGAIGALTGLHADFFLGPHFGGFRERMRNVLLLDMAIHTFDAGRFMAGALPRAVTASETNPPGSWYAHGASAFAVFEMGDGLTFTYRGSWCAEGAPTSWEASWRFTGTRGTLLWDGADGFEARRVVGAEGFFRPVEPVEAPPLADVSRAEGYVSLMREFVAAVRGGPEPETVGSDNIHSLAMVFGAIDSAASGQRIELLPDRELAT